MSTTHGEFLENMQTARHDWEAILGVIPESRMAEPGVVGQWSLKDLIAHITWYEREMIGVIQQRALTGSDLWNKTTDERNAVIYEENKDRSLEDVRDEARRVYAQLYAALECLTDDDLNDPSRFAEMLPDWLPWHIFAQNTYEHYDHHTGDVYAWLEKPVAAPRELLKRHTHLFNYGVLSGDFSPMLSHFKPNAELIFEGVPVGPFKGKPAITAAYAAQPPTDEIEILKVSENLSSVTADYAWRKTPDERAGQMIITFDGEQIARLIIIYS